MKLKTLAWIQIIIGVILLINGLWIEFAQGLWFTQLGTNFVSWGTGLFAIVTGCYNLKQKK